MISRDSIINSILSVTGCSGRLCVAVADYEQKQKQDDDESEDDQQQEEEEQQERVLVVVDVLVFRSTSSKVRIVEHALQWAISNIAGGDQCALLTVVAIYRQAAALGQARMLSGECAMAGAWKSVAGSKEELEGNIRAACSALVHKISSSDKLCRVKVKVIPSSSNSKGIVAAQAKRFRASWIVLDRHFRSEAKRCCVQACSSNVVVVSRDGFKVLCLRPPNKKIRNKGKITLPLDEFELGLPAAFPYDPTTRIQDEPLSPSSSSSCSCSSSDNEEESSNNFTVTERGSSTSSSVSDAPASKNKTINCLDENLISQTQALVYEAESYIKNMKHMKQQPHQPKNLVKLLMNRSMAAAGSPPPICSICQHPSPAFGRAPRRFTYSELEVATRGFCKMGFLGEGGYGCVFQGLLADGIPIAVKQYKSSWSSQQGDMEFCTEVEVLSCAQHRNLVMLIGYCIDKKQRLLVYEFVCNGSLHSHLYADHRQSDRSTVHSNSDHVAASGPLKWSSRHKIALGAARGLRYLHEECRVGCIIHRDFRPSNILLTHDFEPMVGDFGLARWRSEGELSVETRVIGTLGYLAPEYAQTGQISEKADVYSFGVVLLELITGRKAVDLTRPRRQQYLADWARSLLEKQAYGQLMDPALGNQFTQDEALCMLHAASLCTQRDPQQRPRMSQVLRMLEGDMTFVSSSSSRYSNSPSSLAAHVPAAHSDLVKQNYSSAHPIVMCNIELSHEALRAAYNNKEKYQQSGSTTDVSLHQSGI